jgi:hypothetical protein
MTHSQIVAALKHMVWVDRLLDYAHDAGAQVQWGRRDLVRLGRQPEPQAWMSIVLPDGPHELTASTYDLAAWATTRRAVDALTQQLRSGRDEL